RRVGVARPQLWEPRPARRACRQPGGCAAGAVALLLARSPAGVLRTGCWTCRALRSGSSSPCRPPPLPCCLDAGYRASDFPGNWAVCAHVVTMSKSRWVTPESLSDRADRSWPEVAGTHVVGQRPWEPRSYTLTPSPSISWMRDNNLRDALR